MKSIQATEFQNESYHVFENICNLTDKLQKSPTEKTDLYKSYLYWHEIKSLASLYNLSDISQFAFSLEALFESAYNGSITLTKENIADIRSSIKNIKAIIQAIIYDQPLEQAQELLGCKLFSYQPKSPPKKIKNDKSAEKENPSQSKQTNAPVKILIVEDEPINQALIEANIKFLKKDIEIISVNSAEEGLYHFFTNKFSLIFLDIMMPIIDGNDFIAIVEKNLIKKNIPQPCNIIVQTAIQSIAQLTSYAKKECVQEIIRKPIAAARIKECVMRYCFNDRRSATSP